MSQSITCSVHAPLKQLILQRNKTGLGLFIWHSCRFGEKLDKCYILLYINFHNTIFDFYLQIRCFASPCVWDKLINGKAAQHNFGFYSFIAICRLIIYMFRPFIRSSSGRVVRRKKCRLNSPEQACGVETSIFTWTYSDVSFLVLQCLWKLVRKQQG